MARLKPPVGRTTGGSDCRDRGQFLLIGAFGIAVFLLVLAGVVNTVGYTESLAAGDRGTPSRDVSAFREDARRGVAGILERINDESGDHEAKVARFVDGVDDWGDAANTEYAFDGTGVATRVTDTTNETRITQSSVRELTDARGDENWELARSIGDTTRFELELDENSLYRGDCSSGFCYGFVVDDGGSEWRVSVSQSTITVDGPGTYDQCGVNTGPDGTVTIDVIDGEPCDSLTVTEEVSGSYEIRYRNGENATGTYRLDVLEAVVDDGNYGGSGPPSVTYIIERAEIAVSYWTPRLTATSDVPVSEDDSDA